MQCIAIPSVVSRQPAEAKPRIGTVGVLKFIKDEIAAGHPFPTNFRIAAHFDWHVSSAKDALHRLYIQGHIKLLEREWSGRGWRYKYDLRWKEAVRA